MTVSNLDYSNAHVYTATIAMRKRSYNSKIGMDITYLYNLYCHKMNGNNADLVDVHGLAHRG